MNLSFETSVSGLTVFIQGLLSFFSPCILPLVPLYIGYLAGGTKVTDADGKVSYSRKRVLVNTLFFIIGIGFAFVLLGMGFTAIGRFFSGNKIWFIRIGGVIMILFGVYQLGIFGKEQALEQEYRLPFRLDKWAMSPLVALILGFTFSFAWTPCVGPVLASVLLMASSAATTASGFGLIGVYMLGFVLPFLAVGIFTSTVLDFFKRHQRVIKYTVKIGGVLLIVMGIMTITGWMNGITGYLSSFGGGNDAVVETETEAELKTETATETEAALSKAPDFTLMDQNGATHTLSEYQGKTVFLNFWATWCGPCQQEMPDIQMLYEEYGYNEKELIILGVANPSTDDNPKNADVSLPEVTQFMADGGYAYPVVMDTTGEIFGQYGISAFPTTFMINAEGDVYGYVTGMLTEDVMRSIIEQTINGE